MSNPNSRRKPDRAAAQVRELCRYIETHPGDAPDLAELAARTGLSRFHLQRSFKAVTGVTPKQYRRGGEGVSITYAAADSPLGRLMIGATDRGLCFVQFGESDEELVVALRREYPTAAITPIAEPHSPAFDAWIAALNRHLAGKQPHLDLPLDIRATAFQMRVWNYLQSIPYGSVQSYGEVAAAIGQPKAVRAVAHACASNTVALAIPCHRVIRGTGELGGYRWGLERKRALLDLERRTKAG